MRNKGNKKGQLIGSLIGIWAYRFLLIGLVCLGTLIIVSQYKSIEIDKKPLKASLIEFTLNKCGLDCLKVYEWFYVGIKMKDKKEVREIGSKDLKFLCELKFRQVKLKEDLYCKKFNLNGEEVLIGVKNER